MPRVAFQATPRFERQIQLAPFAAARQVLEEAARFREVELPPAPCLLSPAARQLAGL